MKRFIQLCLLAIAPIFGAFPEICGNCWYKVPNSNLSQVAQEPTPPGWGGSEGRIGHNGGAFDSRRNRLIVTGGGGADYSGNEVYAFDVDSLKWYRIKNGATEYDQEDPLYAYYLNGGAVPDSQQPRPGYNFDQIEYDSISDNLYIFGASFAAWYGTTWPNIFQLNMATLTWSHPGDIQSEFHGGNLSARDPSTGKILFYGNGTRGWLASYNPSTSVLNDHGEFWSPGGWITSHQNAAIMPTTNRMISVGSGEANYWDIVATGQSDPHSLTTTGCDSLLGPEAPGFEWSPVDNKMVGWVGGTKVITMDTTYACVEVAASDSNTVTPNNPSPYGTFGRWRYVPKHNVFIVVNSSDSSVYFYRHSPGTGSPPPSPPTVVITSPSQDTTVSPATIMVRYTVNAVPDSQSFSLVSGVNELIVSATNGGGPAGIPCMSLGIQPRRWL